MALCLRSRSRQGAKLELPSESESRSRLSRVAPYSSMSLKNHPAWQQRCCQTKTVMPSQWPWALPRGRAEGYGAWSFQATPADCRAWKISGTQKKSGLSHSFLFLVLYARTPLTIVAHILPGRPVVIRPTLGAMGSSVARYDCLSTAEPADVYRIATADAVELRGEGRGGNC